MIEKSLLYYCSLTKFRNEENFPELTLSKEISGMLGMQRSLRLSVSEALTVFGGDRKSTQIVANYNNKFAK